MILADVSLEGISLTSEQMAKICRKAFGGSNRSYANLLRRLEKNGLISIAAPNPESKERWVPNLTTAGITATSELSPQAAWDTPWDEKWVLLTFDLPTHANKDRSQLRRWLQALRFGKLQGSVWVSPKPLLDIEKALDEIEVDPKSLVCMEGVFWSNASNDQYVEKAWPLDLVQAAYSDYLKFLDLKPQREKTLEKYLTWRSDEKRLWAAALEIDPLLPKKLWPLKRRESNLALEAESRRQVELKGWLRNAMQW